MPGSLAEQIYYKMPVLVQNGIFSIYGWTLSRRRYNRFFYDHLARLMEMEWWSSEQIEEYQNQRITEIVRHAYGTVPFYRKWYDEHGIDVDRINSISDLNKLPVLTKNIAKANQHEMISSAYKRGSLFRVLTSGTTGTPLNIYQTPEGMAYQWAVWWRHKSRFGLTLKDRELTFGARVSIDQGQWRPPYWRHDYFNNRSYLSTYHFKKKSIDDIVTYLNSTHFDFFSGYPSAMYALASLMDEAGLRLYNRPKYVVTGADALLPNYELLLRRVFGAPVTEQYGMAEFAGNMSKCQHGKFHVDFECCHVEALPREGSDCHSLVLTGWGNYAMPFIRYEVGDYVGSADSGCDCGRKTQCFSSVEGRLEDYVLTPDGRKLIGMNQVFEYAENAREIQIYQTNCNGIEFKIVPERGFGDRDKNALIREFRRRAGEDMEISFSMVDELERSSTGKLKAVVSRVAEYEKH